MTELRVFLPGDVVPPWTPVLNHVGGLWCQHTAREIKPGGYAVELTLPPAAEIAVAVESERARRAAES